MLEVVISVILMPLAFVAAAFSLAFGVGVVQTFFKKKSDKKLTQ